MQRLSMESYLYSAATSSYRLQQQQAAPRIAAILRNFA